MLLVKFDLYLQVRIFQPKVNSQFRLSPGPRRTKEIENQPIGTILDKSPWDGNAVFVIFCKLWVP